MRFLIVALLIGLLGCGSPQPVERLTPTPTAASVSSPPTRHTPPVKPSPTPTVQPKIPPQERSVSAPRDIRKLITTIFGSHAPQMIRIVSCETGGTFNPKVTGRAGERGLAQMHPVHRRWIEKRWGWARMYEPRANLEAAYALFKREGFRPWTCARKLGIA